MTIKKAYNIITAYEDWKIKNSVSDIIITNKSKLDGYIKFNNTDIWFKFTKDENLKGWIKHNNINRNVNKIVEYIVDTCCKSEDEYKLFYLNTTNI